jgi:polysaccharide deacetylase family protein (PEP-CTERM system associated)
MLNALTFDVEDYFHVHAFAGVIPREEWDGIPTRVVMNTRTILRVLKERGTRATFFVLGWVAHRHPEIVREIADGGHELATHGFAHESVYELSPDAFRSDVQRSINAIADACPATTVRGYRAPSFSINEKTPWAFDELAKLGMRYDSSISPATFHDRYGSPAASRFAHRLPAGLLEIPVSTIRALGCNWQVAGGGYFRLAPFRFTSWAVQRINKEGHPAVVYLHPWEFDPAQPRISAAPLRSRFRHYVNLRHTVGRLRRLLEQCQFGPISESFGAPLSDACSSPGAINRN